MFVGTIQNDWWTPEWEKLAVLDKVQPNPSFLTSKDNKICLSRGQWANDDCKNDLQRKRERSQVEPPVVGATPVEAAADKVNQP